MCVAKVVTQKTFVTIQEYQKQQNMKKRGQQLLDGNDVNKSFARRKLSLDNDVTKDVNNGKTIENSKKKIQVNLHYVIYSAELNVNYGLNTCSWRKMK